MLGALVFVAGCYEEHRCKPEQCNYVDDDCDGEVDEDFVDSSGHYASSAHCGACGVSCAEAFPTADETTCSLGSEPPRCEVVRCAPGFHRAGTGGCVADQPVLCLPCDSDADCKAQQPRAACLQLAGEGGRCVPYCDHCFPTDGCLPPESLCPAGTKCVPVAGSTYCLPTTDSCGCTADSEGLEIACTLQSATGSRCAGVRRCGPAGFGDCEPVHEEACNGLDDDCDGEVDEDFRDSEGRYVSRLHCGACGAVCPVPGPRYEASCVVRGADVVCESRCEEGFVDVDGEPINGCECELYTAPGPPPPGRDADCDGVVEPSDGFLFVSQAGDDANPGTIEAPLRTIPFAVDAGARQDKDLVVARGIYEGPVMVRPGVSIFGGYSPDFRERDLALHPVWVERSSGQGGLAVLQCRGVQQPTRLDGFTFQGSDAVEAGKGSTTAFFDGCGPEVALADVQVFAADGADGTDGVDSRANLAQWGLTSLSELDGEDGGYGVIPAACSAPGGGAGGKTCFLSGDVAGGSGGGASCPDLGCVNGEPCANAGCTDFTVDGQCDFEAVLRQAVPNPAASAGRGTQPGEAGERTYSSPTNRRICNFCDDNPTLPRDGGSGGEGAPGRDGQAGGGCTDSLVFNWPEGRAGGGAGTLGEAGTDGSGGGGGTAGAGYAVIGGTDGTCNDEAGGSGGGGGSGGCGAPAADGGTGGGASVGVIVRLASGASSGPTFERVRVVTARGGSGGSGGAGAAGGKAGLGGIGGATSFWCARRGGQGGNGGRGGAAGGGGGGCGGGSHGVVVAGAAAGEAYANGLAQSVEVEAAGVAGAAGEGGFSPGNPGSSGLEGGMERVVFRSSP